MSQRLVHYGQLCAIMYHKPRIPSEWSVWDVHSHRVARFNTRTHQIVVIRGSNRVAHLGTNLDARVYRVRAPDGSFANVHAGYWNASNLVWNRIQHTLDLERPILCLGHSLGGALAAILARTLADAAADLSVVTFGCPGYIARSDRWDLSLSPRPHVLHVVSPSDPVCRVPFHMHHHGILWNIDSGMVLCPTRPPWNKPFSSRYTIMEHHIHSYIRKLKERQKSSLPLAPETSTRLNRTPRTIP